MEILTFFVMTLQTSCGAFRHRERVTLQTSCGAERVNPQAPGEGEISLPHSRAIFSKLKNEDKDLFSFRNCKT